MVGARFAACQAGFVPGRRFVCVFVQPLYPAPALNLGRGLRPQANPCEFV